MSRDPQTVTVDEITYEELQGEGEGAKDRILGDAHWQSGRRPPTRKGSSEGEEKSSESC